MYHSFRICNKKSNVFLVFELLVLEKNTGNVKVVSHGILQIKPILLLSNIDSQAEIGLLGLAVFKENKINKDQNNTSITNTTTTSSTMVNKINYKDSAVAEKQAVSQISNNYLVFLYVTQKLNNNNNNDSKKKTVVVVVVFLIILLVLIITRQLEIEYTNIHGMEISIIL